MNQKYILVSIVLAIAGYYLFTKRHEIDSSKISLPFPSEADHTNEGIRSSGSNDDELIAKKRRRFIAEHQLGLQSHTLPQDNNGNVKLDIAIISQKRWCQKGDLDYIKANVAANSTNKVLLSVEEIGNRQSAKAKKLLSLEELGRRSEISFTIPTGKSNRLHGIYLCTVRSENESCQNKQAVDFAKLPEENKAASNLFYFQSFYLNQDQLKIPATLANRNNDRYFKNLERFTDADQRMGLNQVQKSVKSLGSLASRYIKQTFIIPLPQMDSRCPI